MSSWHSLALGAVLLAGCNREPAVGPPPAGTVAVNGVTLKTASIELPSDDRDFPEAPGADAVRQNCTACHSSAMILSQPHLTRAQWQAEVEKMQKAYKAPIDPAAVPAIVGYLTGLSASDPSPLVGEGGRPAGPEG